MIESVPCAGSTVAEKERTSPLISDPENTSITAISSETEKLPEETTGAKLEPGATVIYTVPVFDVAHD